ncbi:Protein of unknown function (DUF3097) [Stackebrandtia albiflava]|uniref:DUF3097 family protein n=1 Tax=Stackebrandtia albiflava TaxID=406432 RepID=A0A562V4Z2_9ACTN|nr:DUF3097 domain-containing protein [Stackebrandtia albiflava]TWJ12964.1 Protein of unknown function (DUF3097) [Stackebrandtia albiflava]
MRYGNDVLSGDRRGPRRRPVPEVVATPDVVAEDPVGGFCGAVVACDKDGVTLEDRHGARRVFPWRPAGFLIDGEPVTLVRPKATTTPPHRLRSASGSTAVTDATARVARRSRIYVEGVHDAELVERIWGHDLRVEGIAVEFLAGIDDLPAVVAEFAPTAERRLGVLVDHLVPGSKESRIAARASGPHVLVCGHPFVDVWQAVTPAAVGIPEWPEVPPGEPWKEGVVARLGWRMTTGEAWRHILSRVNRHTDLEPALLGRVEELIDFVTAPGTA